MKAGTQSALSFLTDEDMKRLPLSANPLWRLGIARHEAGDTSILLESAYTRDEYSAPFCKLTTEVDYHPAAPPWETLKFEPSLLVRQPSIAMNHMSLEGVTLPSPTVWVEFVCAVDRHSGTLDCAPPSTSKVSDEVRRAAYRRTLAMRVDTKGLDPDNPLSVRMDLKVELSTSDRRPIDFLQTPRVRLSDFVWAEQPSAQETQSAYPKSLLEQDVSAKVGVTCQVEPDLSLLCTVTDPDPAGDAQAIDDYKKLAFASVAVMSLYQAVPALRSGWCRLEPLSTPKSISGRSSERRTSLEWRAN